VNHHLDWDFEVARSAAFETARKFEKLYRQKPADFRYEMTPKRQKELYKCFDKVVLKHAQEAIRARRFSPSSAE